MYRYRAVGAVAVLAALLVPWVRVAAVSAHLSAEHHRHAANRHASDLEDSLHGHRHDEGETGHHHALIGFDLVRERGRSLDDATAPAFSQAAGVPASLSAIPALFRFSARSARDHDPPPRGPQRIVLRI